MKRRKKITDETVTEVSRYYVENNSTVRGTAVYFERSKSWVYHILTVRLIEVDAELFEEALEVLEFNKKARASRGGNALRIIKGWRKKDGNSKKTKV